MDTPTSASNALIDELVAALGAEAVRRGDAIAARYQADWSGAAPVRPLALLRPASTNDVAAAMRICHAHRVPVVPQGGLTGLAGGAMPHADAVALSQAYPFTVLAEVTGHEEAALADSLQAALAEAMEDGSVLDAVVAQSQAQAGALWR